jgi:membrane-associated phospholipid phosphatase
VELDRSLARWSNKAAAEMPLMSATSANVAVAGSWTAAGLLAFSWLHGTLRGQSARRRAAERAFAGVAVTYVIVEALGRILPRPRPFADLPGTNRLVSHTEHRSFPSRHVASAFAMALAVAPGSRALAVAFGAIGMLLGAARIAAGVHYPSDVISAIVLGSMIGRVIPRQS